MTQPPAWVNTIPNYPGLHTAPARTALDKQVKQISQDQFNAVRTQFQNWLWQEFLTLVTGSPAAAANLEVQLAAWGTWLNNLSIAWNDFWSGNWPGALNALFGTGTATSVTPGAAIQPSAVPNITASMSTDLQAMIDDTVNAFLNLTVSGQNTSAAKSAQSAIYSGLQAVAATLQQFTTTSTGQSNSGQNFDVSFASYPNGAFPTNFDLNYVGSGNGYIDISGGHAYWVAATNAANRTLYARYNQGSTNTDYQVITGTLASPMTIWGTASAVNGLMARANSAASTFIYANLTINGPLYIGFLAEVGCFVAGTKTVFATGIPVSLNMQNTLEVGVGSNPYQIRLFSGNNLALDYTDAAHVSQLGSSYRSWGFINADNGSGLATPGDGTAIGAADNAPPTLPGCGARVCRVNTANVTITTGSNQMFASGFFDTTSYDTSTVTDFTWDGQGITCLRSMFVVVTFVAAINSGTSSTDIIRPLLWTDTGSGYTVFRQAPFTYSGATGFTWFIPVAAGTKIAPGYYCPAASDFWVGDAGGLGTFFEVGLANLSYN